MSRLPCNSPWGEIQHCEVMRKGVFMVDAENHGGIMIQKNEAAFLSDYARNIALKADNYLCFEMDADEQLVIREMLDKKLYELPDHITDKTAAIENMNRSVQGFHPEYWELRLKSLSAPVKPMTLAEKLEEGKEKAATYNSARQPFEIPNAASSKKTGKAPLTDRLEEGRQKASTNSNKAVAVPRGTKDKTERC